MKVQVEKNRVTPGELWSLKALAKILGISADGVQSLVESTQENANFLRLFLKNLFLIVIGTVKADRIVSCEERNTILLPFLRSIGTCLPVTDFEWLSNVMKTAPSARYCATMVLKMKGKKPFAVFDQVIEHVGLADGEFCPSEKKFLDDFREATGRVRAIPVVATMSSGKSTLINALLGSELLPTSNQACTSTVFKIENYTGLAEFKSRCVSQDSGVSDWGPCTLDRLSGWNSDGVSEIEILGDFSKRYERDVHTVLFDTPGPNNSIDKHHSEITYSILKKANYGQTIVVLNAEQLGIDDEQLFLEQLEKSLDGRAQEVRHIFVLNKFDSLDFESESGTNFIENVLSRLRNIGIDAPVVIPTMSRLALEIRQLRASTEKLPWTNRHQRRFLRSIKNIEANYSSLMSAIMWPRQNEKLLSLAMKNAIDYGKSSYQVLDSYIESKRLDSVELLTGIPLLEAALFFDN